MVDPLQDSLLREVDEDLRHERYAKLWKQYGAYVIGGAVLFVVVVAGYQGWKSYDLAAREADGQRFAQAIDAAENYPDGAEQMLGALAEDGAAGYPMLARLRLAAVQAEQGQSDAAIATYQGIAGEASDPLIGDLAVVLGAIRALNAQGTSADLDKLAGDLEPLISAGNPWRFSARETLGAIALRQGDTDRARELFSSLINDPEAPQGVRTRASLMLASVGGS